MPFLPATQADFVSNATTSTKESVTGATVPGPNSRVIELRFEGEVTVVATTTGVQFGIDVPAGATITSLQSSIQSAAATGTDSVTVSTTATDDEVEGPGDMAVAAATGGNRFELKARVVLGATGGDIQLRIDTDAAAAATVKKGVTRWYQDCCPA